MFRAWGFYMKLAKLIRSLGPGCLFGFQVLWMWGLAKRLPGLNLLENFNAVLSLVCSLSLLPGILTVLQGNPEPLRLRDHGLAARSVTGEEAREASTAVTTFNRLQQTSAWGMFEKAANEQSFHVEPEQWPTT